MEPFSANQALQLLWVLEKENSKYELELTSEEIKHLQMSVISQWDDLTTHYKKMLLKRDLHGTLLQMVRNLPIFQ